MREWRQTAEKNKRLQKKKISAQDQNEIKTLYDQAKKRLILLDYDGTLTAFKNHPEDAVPPMAFSMHGKWLVRSGPCRLD